MKTITTLLVFICFGLLNQTFVKAQSNEKLSSAAEILFKDIITKLSTVDKNSIAEQAALTLSPGKRSFIIDYAPEANYSVFVYPLDMNKDGNEEIFIVENSSVFGQSEGQFSLFVKDKKGNYYPAALKEMGLPVIVLGSKKGYPNLIAGMPGDTQPMLSFNGKKYVFYKSVKESSALKIMDISEASKTYTATLK